MRALTAKQKKLLDSYIEQHKVNGHELFSYDELTIEESEKIEAINDTEILWQEVNRYINDKRMERMYGGK